MSSPVRRPRNDPRQYDDLADSWWDPRGSLAMLHWIAEARARHIPPAKGPRALLVDLGCGGGLLAPHVAGKGYTHLGVDLSTSALERARAHGVTVIRGDVLSIPLRSGIAEVVSAGEILEHVSDLAGAVAEACRLLCPGGLLVIDTIAATALARLLAVRVAERIPGGAPRGIHDPALFVDRRSLIDECARHGVALELSGLRPSLSASAAYLARLRPASRMISTRSTSVLFQGVGVKAL